MRSPRKWFLLTAVCIGALGFPPWAQAGFLGHYIRATIYHPDLDTPCATCPVEIAMVQDPDLEFESFPGDPPYSIIDADFWDVEPGIGRIDILFVFEGGFSPSDFTGVVFDDVYGEIDEIESVTLLSSSEPQFGSSRILVDAERIGLNFQGIVDVRDDTISLQVQFVPEPGTALLLAAGLAALALARRAKSPSPPSRGVSRSTI